MDQDSAFTISNKRILVTGAAGFLGSHLCESLLLQSNEVVGLDNFCSGNVELVVGTTGSRSRVVHAPLPVDDPRQRRPDISLARVSLGWTPIIGLRQGLALTTAHFERVLCPAYAEAAQ